MVFMTTPSSHAHDLAILAELAARAVADYLRQAANSRTEFTTKTDFHDPVTMHDKAVESALRTIMGQAVPSSRVLGEEHGEAVLDPKHLDALPAGILFPAGPQWDEATSRVGRLGSRVRWIVDPIDGTANFAAGLPWFNTSIGVELDGTIIAGVVSAPLLFEMFTADDTHAWLSTPSGTSELNARGATSESQAVISTYHPGSRALAHDSEQAGDQERRIMNAYQTTRRFGAAALDLAYVAAGRLGAMLGTNFKPWDVAAGLHLVKVAGGSVLNVNLATSLPIGLRPGVLAWGGAFEASTAKEVLSEIEKSWSK